MVICFRSVTYFVLVLRLADQGLSIDLQRSTLDCFLVKVDSVVLSLEVDYHYCHLVTLECVVLLEVEVVMEVIQDPQNALSVLKLLEVVECSVSLRLLNHPSCRIPQ